MYPMIGNIIAEKTTIMNSSRMLFGSNSGLTPIIIDLNKSML